MHTSERDPDGTVLIIGGGIGGLAAAIGLQAVGIDVEVYEQAQELREVGAGLTVWQNGLAALECLGGHDAAVRAGATITRNDVRTPEGSLLRRTHLPDVAPTGSELPALICLHRAELQTILRDRVGDGVVHLDHECVGVEDDGGAVTARFSDGSEVSGSLLVGADGIHSVVRSSLHGETEPRVSGVGVWRAITRFDQPIATGETISQTFGKGQRFVAVPLGDGRVYWVVTERVQQGSERPTADSKERLARRLADWHEPVPALIEATPQAALIWDEAVDREPLDEWGRGRITLLGDAAHLALPFVGQGASQALEDAVWLTRQLDSQPDATAALRAYEAHRRDRTAMIVRSARRIGRMFHLTNPLAVAVRNRLWKYGPRRLFVGALKRNITAEL